MGYVPRFMNMHRLREEAEKYGCEFVQLHSSQRIFKLCKGERWTFIRNPATDEPIQRIRDVGISEWQEAIAKSAEFLMSDEYGASKE